MKKLVSLILIITLAITAFGCGGKEKQLSTPTNVQVNDQGLITWSSVENATGYIVTVNGKEYQTETTSYQVSSTVNDFTYSIVATANGYKNSEPTQTYTFEGKGEQTPPTPTVKVGIGGADQIKSGGTVKLTAKVEGTVDVSVEWTIIEGSEFASVDNKGNVTATEVTGDKIIKVEARSKVDKTAYAEKVLTIVAKPKLTQDMLDALNDEYVAFSGYINIDVYDDSSLGGSTTVPEQTSTSVIKTSMNGTYWYAEYENANTGLNTPIYYKKHENKACQVGLSFLNEEEYFPMVDAYGNEVSWEDSGLYNSLTNLKVSDFTFDEESWRYVYTGSDSSLTARVIASADPYDFSTETFALIIEEGEVMGIYAKSKPDYTLVTGYMSIQHLYVSLICGEEFVEVPTIEKYTHEDIHDGLNQAIANMHNLSSYTVEFLDLNVDFTGTGYTETGFTETITEDLIHFRPYTMQKSVSGESTKVYKENGEYGYKVMRDGLYNAYVNNGESYYASRAYEGDINNAKPTFAFVGEIFRSYYEESDGSVTYYVDDPMSSVASTFFYGVGNDINLYGIFATRAYTGTTSFTPFVTVKDGYITEACFYYNIGGLLYGVIELQYSDFNSATVAEEEIPQFEIRELPTSWLQLEIILNEDSTSTSDDQTINALDYFKQMYGENITEEDLPFFGDVLGDAFGFGLQTIFRPQGSAIAKSAVVLYYDVPLDTDYTINTSLESVKQYLREEGFVQISTEEFKKGDVVVVPRDENLDFLIYMYKA